MLDTGIDIPEIVNLVFFKLVRSKTKFWQMLGRGTRLCPDLFGPGQDKTQFQIFDFCGNLEFFSLDPKITEGSATESLGKRLFVSRLELVEELGRRAEPVSAPVAVGTVQAPYGDPATDAEVSRDMLGQLHREVAAMNLDNFLVRPQRRLVERYAKPEAWNGITRETAEELARYVAGLPAELDPEPEEAKRFDLLLLGVELAVLRSEPGFQKLRDRVREIASCLEELSAIPMVREHMALIQEVQSDEWWVDVTVPMLERVRRKLRLLARLVEKRHRRVLFTDFEDAMGPEERVELPGLAASVDFEKFREKARVFLRSHEDDVSIRKLRMNKPLTTADLASLEKMLEDSGCGGAEEINRAKRESDGLGLFVRSLVGLDRAAAKEALAGFLSGKRLGANQIEFVNLIVDHLTEHGVMPAALLYESPFTDITPRGPDGIFASVEVDELITTLLRVRATAIAA
jgi:type I restriction enzyme R subunit